MRCDHFGHGARADQVVDDRRAGMLLEQRDGDHGGDHVAADELALLIDQEHAVGVAVERDAEIASAASTTVRCRSAMFSGSIGLARWFGKVPSSSK